MTQQTTTDHRTRVTRMLIRKAFMELLKQKPIQSISIKELCAAAGINRGTFYAHYQDIYVLLEQIEADMVAQLQTLLEPIYESVTEEHFLVEVCTGIFQCLKDNSDICVVMLGDHSDKAFVDRLLALGKDTCITAYSRYFTGADHRQLEYFYAFVSAGCIGLLRQWIHDGMRLPAAELAQLAEEIMLCGIGMFSQSKKPEGTAPQLSST